MAVGEIWGSQTHTARQHCWRQWGGSRYSYVDVRVGDPQGPDPARTRATLLCMRSLRRCQHRSKGTLAISGHSTYFTPPRDPGLNAPEATHASSGRRKRELMGVAALAQDGPHRLGAEQTLGPWERGEATPMYP